MTGGQAVGRTGGRSDRRTAGPPTGVTLVEILVVLVILGIVTSVSGLGLMSLRQPPVDAHREALETARVAAIMSGQPVFIDDSGRVVRFLPDGRALGSGVDPLTGEVTNAVR